MSYPNIEAIKAEAEVVTGGRRAVSSRRQVLQTHPHAVGTCPICLRAIERDEAEARQLAAELAEGLGPSDEDLVGDEG